MSLRRLFLLGAATLASVAALIAIAAVLSGDFGETEGKIFATLATAFVAGSASIAGVACLARGSRLLGGLGVVLACGGFVLWAEQIWAQNDSDGYWRLLGVVTAWTLATLIANTTRLLTGSPQLLRTLYPATVGAAVLAALVATAMLLREEGDGWQLLAVLIILAVLGEILTPILERYVDTAEEVAEERLLGTIRGVDVYAVRRRRGAARTVRVGPDELRLADDEAVVVRPSP